MQPNDGGRPGQPVPPTDPNQPVPPAQPVNPYEFILNETPALKRRFGASTAQRLLLFGAGLLVLFFVGIALLSLLNDDSGHGQLQVDVGVKQQELIRIATLGSKDARDTEAKGYSNTVKSTVQTDYNNFSALISESTKKQIDQQVKAADDSAVKNALEKAGLNNAYDEQLYEVLDLKLKAYQVTLKQAFDATTNSRFKSAYGTAHTNAGDLIRRETVPATDENAPAET